MTWTETEEARGSGHLVCLAIHVLEDERWAFQEQAFGPSLQPWYCFGGWGVGLQEEGNDLAKQGDKSEDCSCADVQLDNPQKDKG